MYVYIYIYIYRSFKALHGVGLEDSEQLLSSFWWVLIALSRLGFYRA